MTGVSPGLGGGSLEWGVLIDLHTHSHVSDGTDAPAALVAAAAGRGSAGALADGVRRLDVVALTDHDTVGGWVEAAAAAREHGIDLVLGTEVSARAEGISVHLLSYLHDPHDAGLLALFDAVRVSRGGRARAMVERLGADFPVTWEDVVDQTQPGTTIGRPHIADALVAAGVCASRDVAFADLLHTGSPYYVRHAVPDAPDAVRAIVAAGGVAVMAHPGAHMRGRIVSDAVIEELAAAGLAGLEVAHRDNDDAQRVRLDRLAQRLGLLTTGSSDFHGDGKPNRLGENLTSSEALAEIERRGTTRMVRA